MNFANTTNNLSNLYMTINNYAVKALRGCEVCFTCIHFNINCFQCRWPTYESESILYLEDDDYCYEHINNPGRERCGFWKDHCEQ